MDTSGIHPTSSVDQVLRTWPQAAAVFIQMKTNCIGCMMRRFCTLQDVASYCGLNAETLMQALQENVQPKENPTICSSGSPA